MSKVFYPIIDYDKCIECGLCIEECEYGVYDEEKSPKSAVINPDACNEECFKCVPVCSVEAITYFEQLAEGGCGCGNECGDDSDCDCEGDCGDDCECHSSSEN